MDIFIALTIYHIFVKLFGRGKTRKKDYELLMCDSNWLLGQIFTTKPKTHLVMLVKLATEGNCEVSCCSTGDCTSGVQRFAALIRASTFANFHVLET